MPEITFVRHAESQANVEGIWNGRNDGPLSERGEASLEGLAHRLGKTPFDLVISSPLERARQTAAVFSDTIAIEPDFTEIDLGVWEGRTVGEVVSESGDELRKALTDRVAPMGVTGESLTQVAIRGLAAVDRLVDRLGDDGRAAVVTHGGLLQTLLHRHLADGRRRVHAFVDNVSLTKLVWFYDRPRLASFNDTGHLGPRSATVARHLDRGEPVLALVRHGQTRANVEGRWQGQGDWGLDETGLRQAEALATWYGRHETVYSSPLGRASQTAASVASNGFEVIDDLREVGMGRWEDMTTDEVLQDWPELMERIYRDGVDLRRGETGESWGELTARFGNALGRLQPVAGAPTVVVAHGGAIRSYIASLTAVPQTHAEALHTPPNTSVSHVAMTGEGPLILDYAVAPHLDGLY